MKNMSGAISSISKSLLLVLESADSPKFWILVHEPATRLGIRTKLQRKFEDNKAG
jgi:hypothetical protein